VGKGVVKHSWSKEGKEKATEALEGLWPIIHNSCYHNMDDLSSNK